MTNTRPTNIDQSRVDMRDHMEFTLLIIMQQKHLKQIFLKLCSILKMRLYVYIAFPPRQHLALHWWSLVANQ